MNLIILNWCITKQGSLYYKLVQELQSEAFLLQNKASIIIKQGSFALLQSDKINYKMVQLIYYKVGQSLLQWGHVLKKGSFIAKWGRQIGARAITKWGR